MEKSKGKCIIMCAGEFHPMALHREPGDFLIAADNGLTYLESLGEEPDYIIGDYDSLAPEGQEVLHRFEAGKPEEVTHLPVEKDDTDSMAAVKIGLNRGYREFYLYAALGGRLDHTLANIQTLAFLREHGAQGYIMEPGLMLFILKSEACSFRPGFAGDFSCFAMDREVHGVSIQGMKYNVRDITLTNHFPLGVSNHIFPLADGKRATVEVRDGSVVCYVSWKPDEGGRIPLICRSHRSG